MLRGTLVFLVLQSRLVLPSLAYKFALVSKSLGNPFFDPAVAGCAARAASRGDGSTCIYVAPNTTFDDQTGLIQAQVLKDLLAQRSVDAIAISGTNAEVLADLIDDAVVNMNIPVVTFDCDAPSSKRYAYIGTDNHFFGTQLAKVLKQLHPGGGTFVTLAGNVPNLIERQNAFRRELHESGEGRWIELPGSPADAQGNTTLVIELLEKFAMQNPTAIVPVMGLAMRADGYTDFVDRNRHRNITFVSGDAMPNQLQLLEHNYADGLVGQLPYEMGSKAVGVLADILEGNMPVHRENGTNVLTHIHVPLVLPELTVDTNTLGNLAYVGYTFCGMIVSVALSFAYWTYRHRQLYVVRVSQPMFLLMVAAGVVLMAASLVPLSFDDDGSNDLSLTEAIAICMSAPWLACVGFAATFSALFSKLMRINSIFKARKVFKRIKVTERDVLIPSIVLFALNIVTLTCWTVLAPLTYVRENHDGVDGWSRVISTYGACRSSHVTPYLASLAVINLLALAIANHQAYEARKIHCEFSESKYIGVTMASLLQAAVTGIPILFVVRDSPQAFYLVLVFMLFVICAAVLALIFVPKIVMAEAFKRQPPEEQRRRMRLSLRAPGSFNESPGLDGSNGMNQIICTVAATQAHAADVDQQDQRSCTNPSSSTLGNVVDTVTGESDTNLPGRGQVSFGHNPDCFADRDFGVTFANSATLPLQKPTIP